MSEELVAYCVKCKTKRPLANAQAVFTKSAQPATQGECPVCGTTLYRMGVTPAHMGLTPPTPTKKSKRTTVKKGKRSVRRTRAVKKTRATSSREAAPDTPNAALRRRSGKLVIVESPAKAKTIEHYLGKDFKVKASVGHVRDLLKSTLSVNVDNNFEPTYSIPRDKKEIVKELKLAAAQAEQVYLATDP